MSNVTLTDTTARVLEELLERVRWGIVSISRKGMAEKLELTPSQVSRCFKELEEKNVLFRSVGGHVFLNKELLE